MAAGPTSTPRAPATLRVVVAPDTWIRRRIATVGPAVYALAFSLVWVGLPVHVLADKHFHGSRSWGNVVGYTLLFGTFAVLSAIFGVRSARAGLRLGSNGIVLRGPLKTRS